ncbi:hypothetical protein RI129_000685 [Pyrocoelia pectoralis]|uniref:Uncharacterized protein n=1 Tax=Pyrocoelia pectoralis TaxID=417401 RepID=A0AAN7ZW85_9COLE
MHQLYWILCLFVCSVQSKKVPEAFLNVWDTKTEPYRAGCAKEHSVDLNAARNSSEPDDTYSCFVKCVLESVKFFTPEGEFDPLAIGSAIKMLPSDLVKKCISDVASETNLCHKAYLGLGCITDGISEE